MADVRARAQRRRVLRLHTRARGGSYKLAPERPGAGTFAHGWTLAGFGGPRAEEAPRAASDTELLPRSLSRGRTFAEDQDDQRVLDEVYPQLAKKSVDYAIMEPASEDDSVTMSVLGM